MEQTDVLLFQKKKTNRCFFLLKSHKQMFMCAILIIRKMIYLKCLQRRDKSMYACIPVAMMKEKKRSCKPEKFAIFNLKFRYN